MTTKNDMSAEDWKAAEIVFRAFHAGSNASWNQLSDLGKAQWARAAKALREAKF